jgi:protein CWC15
MKRSSDTAFTTHSASASKKPRTAQHSGIFSLAQSGTYLLVTEDDMLEALKAQDADIPFDSHDDPSESQQQQQPALDEQALLERELEKIRQERAEAARLNASLLTFNPNSSSSSSSSSGRRDWIEETVFRNQAASHRSSSSSSKSFVNDTVRNEFHRKFLDRYVK